MIIKEIEVKNIVTKSKLPASDYAVNPYIGCPHKCKYCYACFMRRFSGHEENWGDFIDVKNFPNIKNPHKYDDKVIFLGSVTDAYNPFEAKYKKTRLILEQFVDTNAEIVISTKSNLIIRDLDILTKIRKVTVAFSVNTLDEVFRADMDKAATISERLEAMQILHSNGIYTATFISPIFPEITNVIDIIERTKEICDVYWLENLNLRGGYKSSILKYIEKSYPQFWYIYDEIYNRKNMDYWIKISEEIEEYAKKSGVDVINYFYHDLIRKQ